MESNRLVSGLKYHHLPPGFRIVHRLSWSFSHTDGTCPDPMLLFSREMTKHLKVQLPVVPDSKSKRCQGQWKWTKARDTYYHHDARCRLVPSLNDIDNAVCSLLPKLPSTGWGKISPRGWACLLSTVKLRGRWMTLNSYWSEKEEGQSTKAICCHLRTSAEQRGMEHQDHAGNPCRVELSSIKQGRARATAASAGLQQEQQVPEYVQNITAKGFFSSCAFEVYYLPRLKNTCVCASYCTELHVTSS